MSDRKHDGRKQPAAAAFQFLSRFPVKMQIDFVPHCYVKAWFIIPLSVPQ